MAKEKQEKAKSESKKSSKKEDKIQQVEKERDDYKELYMRTMADFDNYRKRKEKELQEARDRGVISFVESILPAIDNFEMSLKMTDNNAMFVKGVEMIHKNLIDTLKEHHFEEFEPQTGEAFNPYSHDPMLIEDKEAESGKVLGIVKKGYKFKDKVVRPARVQVKKEQEETYENKEEEK
ncbi:MAG: nucleotide exchange factor GrpE [Nanoarchaeota archaeon]